MSRTVGILKQLEDYESRNLVCIDEEAGWPIVWERAKGVHVWDVEGLRYLDYTAGFGVAAAGHGNPRVVKAGRKQMGLMVHAMGDVHPHEGKALLARELSHMTFERWTRRDGRTRGKVIFCNSGFESVEAALKTARLATGKSGVVAFSRAYHGLGYGALTVTHRSDFRDPFRGQLADFGAFESFPETAQELEKVEKALRTRMKRGQVGAVLVEPIQGRGGIRVPAPGFLAMLRDLCDDHGALLVLDEIYTGFGRTGKWFACEHESVVPDLVCLGKALTGGFPLSACVGKADLMDEAWPPSTGESIHTSTYLGHPVGCAMALAQIEEIRSKRLPATASSLGRKFMKAVKESIRDFPVRGRGLMVGIDFSSLGDRAGGVVFSIVLDLLRRGFILLPDGEKGEVLGFTPPLVMTERQLHSVIEPVRRSIVKRLET